MSAKSNLLKSFKTNIKMYGKKLSYGFDCSYESKKPIIQEQKDLNTFVIKFGLMMFEVKILDIKDTKEHTEVTYKTNLDFPHIRRIAYLQDKKDKVLFLNLVLDSFYN